MPTILIDPSPRSLDLIFDKKMRAKKLKAIIYVETNFTDAINYDYCVTDGIHVLTPGSAAQNFQRPGPTRFPFDDPCRSGGLPRLR